MEDKSVSTWQVQFYANGELQTVTRLTDKQIKSVTALINKLANENEE